MPVVMPYLQRKHVDGTMAQEWELPGRPFIVGRGDQADAPIRDNRMSRQHFVIFSKDNAFVVQDLKSTNGTWVNNERITEAELKPNDRIRAGQTVFIYLAEKPKGLNTIMGELAAEGKGLHTFIGELNKQDKKPGPAS